MPTSLFAPTTISTRRRVRLEDRLRVLREIAVEIVAALPPVEVRVGEHLVGELPIPDELVEVRNVVRKEGKHRHHLVSEKRVERAPRPRFRERPIARQRSAEDVEQRQQHEDEAEADLSAEHEKEVEAEASERREHEEIVVEKPAIATPS